MNNPQSKAAPLQSRPTDALVELVEAAIGEEVCVWEHVKAGHLKRSPMFEFCRVLKACGQLIDRDEQEAAELIEEVLGMRNPDASDPWAEEFPYYDDPQASFLANWNVVAFPTGMFDRAVALAKVYSVRPSGAASEGYCRFLSLCAALQRLVGKESIIVSVTKFAGALGVSAQTISTYRKLATRAGYLLQVEPDVPHQLATKFRFQAALTTVSTDRKERKGSRGSTGT